MTKSTKLALLASLTLFSNVAYAAVPATYNADATIVGAADAYTGSGYGISVGNGATLTVTGTQSIAVTSTGGEPVAMNVARGNLNADVIDITLKPQSSTVSTYGKGFILRGNSTGTINTLNSDITLSSVTTAGNGSPDSNAAYGVAVGYNFNGGGAGDVAKLTVKDATIKVTNTDNTIMGRLSRTFYGFVNVGMDSGHQLSGIRVYRTTGAKPEFVSDGNVDIEVTDSSTAKVGDYLAGVYISGNDASATFNGNTNIKVVANGVNSAGIKIGKPLEASNAGAKVISNGKMVVDTTGINGTATIAGEEITGSGAVRLFGDNSEFAITGANTNEASSIKASTNAIVFDTQDYVTVGDVFGTKEVLSRNADNNNNTVSLHNTEVSTTSETAALIKANSNFVEPGLMMTFGSSFVAGKLNTGLFAVDNAKFNLSGQLSKATAASKGWLVHSNSAQDNLAMPTQAFSKLAVNLSDKALAIGQMHKDEQAVLDVTIDDATWQLAKKEDLTEQLSTVSAATLKNGGILDAGTNLTDGSKAIYKVHLTSDGVASDGVFTNDGVITMVNGSYEDQLTIAGNYVGANGKVKMNTEWNSPGDATGGNSKSDLLYIDGSANGSTKVVSVAADGREAVIDGSIASVAADLHAVTVPVVRVKEGGTSTEGAFTGVANTTGAGELQLRHRTNDQGALEYFWEVMAVNPTPPNPNPNPQPNPQPTPIYNKGVPGYVQMPLIDLELGYASMRTLHERRGENVHVQIPANTTDNDQTWVRFIKDYVKVEGKDRFGYKTHIDGIQVGNDFSIKKTDDRTVFSGVYFSYLQGKADFFDRYKAENGVITADKFTGEGKAKTYSLGVTRTSYKNNGAYVDLVGQLSAIRNEYNALGSQSVKQSGWGLGASVEAGRPYVLREKDNKRLVLEPQGQIVFQYLSLADINHDNKVIHQPKQYGLKGRIGARLSYDSYNEAGQVEDTVYGVLNIWQDLVGHQAVYIGQDRITERYARTVGEIGIGTQLHLSGSTYFYGDFRYQHALGSGKNTGYRGQIGLKHTF